MRIEFHADLRDAGIPIEKADIFEKSGSAVEGIVKDYRKSADMIEKLCGNIGGFVEKLIERLSNTCDECIGWNHHKVNAYSNAIRIVNQLAEEYVPYINVRSKNEELIEKINFAIEASNTNDNYMTGLRNGMRYCMALIDGKEPEFEQCNQDSTKKNQGWILCSERLPENYETVNITWINKKPAPYYEHIKDKPFMGTAIFHHGKWYWYSCVCEDYLRECGDSTCDRMDKDIEVIAWQPLPEPYKPEEKQEEPQSNFYTERFNRVI